MYGKDFEADLDRVDSRYPPDQKRAGLIEALHVVQDRNGHVPEDAVRYLAERYGTSPADVQGVISFYLMFFTTHPGKHVTWVCRTFPCELMGARDVMSALESRLGCKVGETDPTGTFHLRWMECLAACDKAPCALIGDDMYENLRPDAVDLVLDHVKAGGGGGRVQVGAGGRPELVPTPRPPVVVS